MTQQTPIDFDSVSQETLFGELNEVYVYNAQTLEGIVDCQFCKLIYDYSRVCRHQMPLKKEDESSGDGAQTLQNLLPDTAQTEGVNSKTLAQITDNLDVLSTSRITSFMLTRDKFAELLVLFVDPANASSLYSYYKDHSITECEHCKPLDDANSHKIVSMWDLTCLGLKITNRCLTYQIESMILN